MTFDSGHDLGRGSSCCGIGHEPSGILLLCAAGSKAGSSHASAGGGGRILLDQHGNVDVLGDSRSSGDFLCRAGIICSWYYRQLSDDGIDCCSIASVETLSVLLIRDWLGHP